MNGECTPKHGERCRNARTARCTCQCGGRNHGSRMRDHEHDECMPLTDRAVFNGSAMEVFRGLAPGADQDIKLWRDDQDNALANIPQSLCYHSPTGFEWGYGGSGPAELALNILNLLVKPAMAWQLHIPFMNDFIIKMPEDGGIIAVQTVKNWIQYTWQQNRIQKQLTL